MNDIVDVQQDKGGFTEAAGLITGENPRLVPWLQRGQAPIIATVPAEAAKQWLWTSAACLKTFIGASIRWFCYKGYSGVFLPI